MTYRLEPWIGKITCPVIISTPGGTQKRYVNGRTAVGDIFDRHYIVEKITAIGEEVVLTVKEVEIAGSTWIGEEQQGFF